MKRMLAALLVLGLATHAEAQILKNLGQRLGPVLDKVLEEAQKAQANRVPGEAGQPGLPAGAQAGTLGLEGEATPNRSGVLVTSVRVGGAADNAGVKPGDQIVGVSDLPVNTLDDLTSVVGGLPAGARLPLTLKRGAQSLRVTAVLDPRGGVIAARPPLAGQPPLANPPFAVVPDALRAPPAVPGEELAPAPAGAGRVSLGVSVVPLTAEAQARYNLTVARGALIASVRAGSPADLAGLPVGGAIVAVDGRRVDDADELIDLVQGLRPGQEIELSYYQGPRLFRKAVRLAPAAAGEAPLVGDPAGDRPLLGKVEQLLGQGGLRLPLGAGLPAAPGPVRPAVGGEADELTALRQEVDALRSQVDALTQRLAEVEATLATGRPKGPPPLPREPPPLPEPPAAAPKAP